MRKKYYNDNYKEELSRFIIGIVILYFLYLAWQYYANRTNFWRWLIYGILVLLSLLAAVITVAKLKEKMRLKKIDKLVQKVRDAKQEEHIKNFIDRFGFEGNKHNSWSFRNHYFDWDRISDLEAFLIKNGIKLRTDERHRDIFILLRHYIQEKEEGLTNESIKSEPQKFKKLSGADFEKLIYRLFTAMGYAVQWIGRSGDQGGDLIANKDGKRLLIQAKCYRDWSTGNEAVQQVVGAMKFHNCNQTAVVTTSFFTPQAVALAKSNNTTLISKENLQKLLLKHLGENWG
ncbi:MAG: restriction endonuclease [Candidatus Falkowbacteria bacterium]